MKDFPIICRQAQFCPRDRRLKKHCDHEKLHKSINGGCTFSQCEQGGVCIPLDLVIVQDERELP